MWKGDSFFFFLFLFINLFANIDVFFFFLLIAKIKFKKRKQRHINLWKWDKWEYKPKTCCICDSLNKKFIFYVYPSLCETKSWRNRVLKLIRISFNLALVQGCDSSVLLGNIFDLDSCFLDEISNNLDSWYLL